MTAKTLTTCGLTLSATLGIHALSSQPDPPMQSVLDALGSLGGKPIETLPPAEGRQQPTPADAVKKVLQQVGKTTAPEKVSDVDNQTVDGPGGTIPIRIYSPAGDGPFPLILYVHGGGWVIADLDTYDASPRALVNGTQAVVVSTHYRQAPEHPYPAAHDDVFSAYQWVVKNGRSIKGDTSRIAVVGESAGGNMAAVTAIRARDQQVQMPVHQVLIYPVSGTDMNTPSYREHANAKPLNKAMMGWFLKHYLGDTAGAGNQDINLATRRDLHGLPPTTIITADIDPLRSEGQMLGEALKRAGVSINAKNYEGSTHEFFGMGAVVPDASEAVQVVSADLKKAFSTERRTSGRRP